MCPTSSGLDLQVIVEVVKEVYYFNFSYIRECWLL